MVGLLFCYFWIINILYLFVININIIIFQKKIFMILKYILSIDTNLFIIIFFFFLLNNYFFVGSLNILTTIIFFVFIELIENFNLNNFINLLNFDINLNLINGLFFIHPFLIYFSYSALILLFSTVFFFCFSFFISRNFLVNFFFNHVRLIILFFIYFIFLAMVLGSWWAYQEVNWGGWWNWDLVEVINFFLFFILCLIYHRNSFYFSFPNFIDFMSSFLLLFIFYFYLVRLGLINSIHSFLESTNCLQFFYLIIFYIGFYSWKKKIKFYFFISYHSIFYLIVVFSWLVVLINLLNLFLSVNNWLEWVFLVKYFFFICIIFFCLLFNFFIFFFYDFLFFQVLKLFKKKKKTNLFFHYPLFLLIVINIIFEDYLIFILSENIYNYILYFYHNNFFYSYITLLNVLNNFSPFLSFYSFFIWLDYFFKFSFYWNNETLNYLTLFLNIYELNFSFLSGFLIFFLTFFLAFFLTFFLVWIKKILFR